MRILYDHQIFSRQRYGGVSRYFAEIIGNLRKYSEYEPDIGIKYSNNEYIRDWGYQKFLPEKDLWHKEKIIELLNCPYTVKALKKGNFDLFHPTYYNPYFLKMIRSKKYVVTVYDMTHEIFPENFGCTDRSSRWKKTVVENADAVIAISENTKNDLVEILGIDGEKISVTHLGSSVQKNSRFIMTALPENFILFVGERKGYKNFQNFMQGITPLLQKEKDLYLICVGGSRFSQSEEDYLRGNDIRGQVIHTRLDDEELYYAYSQARVFVFPSLYEGFGIPILEAFSCGCPVALSHASCFPEIAGDAAGYFKATDPLSIQDTISLVLEDENYRKTLVRKGFERNSAFSWEKCATQTAKIYEECIG